MVTGVFFPPFVWPLALPTSSSLSLTKGLITYRRNPFFFFGYVVVLVQYNTRDSYSGFSWGKRKYIGGDFGNRKPLSKKYTYVTTDGPVSSFSR